MGWLSGINWLAVGIGVLAYYALGGLWFTPLFGKMWDASVGFDRPRGHRFPPMYYIVPLLSSLFVTVGVAVLVNELDIEHIGGAVALGVTAGLGFGAAVSFNNAITPAMPRPLLFGAITAGYHFVGTVLVAVVVTLLR